MADPLSITASVIALIQFSLKSLKLSHEILSGFKDGHETVAQARTDVKNLTTILTQLSTCRVIREDTGQHIRNHVTLCLNEILAFGRSLESLKEELGDGMSTAWWKRFSAMWREKALSKTSARLLNQMQGINLHLTALQSDTLSEIPTKIDQLSRDLATQQDAAASTYRLHLIQNTAALSAVETRLAHHDSGITTTQAVVQQGFADTAKGQQEIFNVLGTGHKELLGAVGTGHQEIMSILAQMLASLATQPASVSPNSQKSLEVAQSQSNKPCQQLVNLVAQLCSTVNDSRLQGKVAHSDSRQITDLLISAVELIKSGHFQQAFLDKHLEKGSCSTCGNHHLKQVKDSLDIVHGSLLSTRGMVVNDIVPKRSATSRGVVLRHQSTVFTCRLQNITLILCSFTKQRRLSHNESNSDHLIDLNKDVVVRLPAIPRSPGRRHAMTLDIRQIHGLNGVFSHIPNLQIHNTLPRGSLVFTLVREGLVDELQALLLQGKASLRDQDEYGASLLQYAIRQPEMCRFLLQHGADVDHVGCGKGPLGDLFDASYSVLESDWNDWEVADKPDILEPLLLCRKYLLEAGADPTVSIHHPSKEGESDNNLECTISGSLLPAVQQISDHGSVFIDINAPGLTGLRPIQVACCYGRGNAETFDLLLRRGSNVTVTDERGNSCLHMYMISNWRNLDWMHYWFGNRCYHVVLSAVTTIVRGVIFLIKNGVDIRATNQDRHSVSDWVCTCDCDMDDDDPANLRSLCRDVWDFCLVSCGYEIDDFRQGRVRKACYCRNYLREVFEELWAGNEHLCPYFHSSLTCP